MTENPFLLICNRLDRLEVAIASIKDSLDKPKASLTRVELLTVKEAATFLNLAVPTVYSKVQNGELPHSRRGRKLYFFEQELTDWIKGGGKKTNAEIKADVLSSPSAKRRGLMRAAA